jgi:hypothetical protein
MLCNYPLLLLQVNKENKDILCIYTMNHGQQRFNCPFILAQNLDDTNLVMVNIVHKWEVCAMLPRTEITCLNYATSMFDKKDTMIQIFELCYNPV